MKIAVWNMEWLNDLVVSGSSGSRLKDPDENVRGPRPPWENSGPTVGQRLALLRQGVNDLDADIVVVVEGPDLTDDLQLIFDTIADGDWTCYAQRSRYRLRPDSRRRQASTQCVGIAVRVDRGAFADEPFEVFDSEEEDSGAIHEATEPFFLDLQEDKIPEWFRYERLPLYVEIKPADGPNFRILGLHLKSKGIFAAYEWSKWWSLADANRQRLLAQCRHLREAFLDRYMLDDATKKIPLLVCGDINDGPGFDTSEMRLNASGVETLMGTVWKPQLCLRNALWDSLDDRKKSKMDFETLTTTRFQDPIFNDTHHKVWIDHILYNDLFAQPWVTEAQVVRTTAEDLAYWKISDHFPVVATIDIPAAQTG